MHLICAKDIAKTKLYCQGAHPYNHLLSPSGSSRSSSPIVSNHDHHRLSSGRQSSRVIQTIDQFRSASPSTQPPSFRSHGIYRRMQSSRMYGLPQRSNRRRAIGSELFQYFRGGDQSDYRHTCTHHFALILLRQMSKWKTFIQQCSL